MSARSRPADPAAQRTDAPVRRTDAQRNRERLIDVATAAFTAGTGKVALESIARDAGVGIGTLYRHFPTREALVEAVYRSELERLCDRMPGLVAAMPADQALREWMGRYADFFETKREMAEALRAVIASGAVSAEQTRARLGDAIQLALDAGAEAGLLRSDIAATDISVALAGIMVMAGSADQREQSDRLLDLLLDGLRPAKGSPNKRDR
ncbi:TetR/AcrR family transcriptional regulator [Microlunatus elymi]|uniref:TetR/AcrR family transcriptional regulator n=1 Tax=Microlunatus elymi TaxID=2596828 RepID=UPI001D17D670|nr:TetR/AcrR family transcriptional regulator [Microlunatus elymi]